MIWFLQIYYSLNFANIFTMQLITFWRNIYLTLTIFSSTRESNSIKNFPLKVFISWVCIFGLFAYCTELLLFSQQFNTFTLSALTFHCFVQFISTVGMCCEQREKGGGCMVWKHFAIQKLLLKVTFLFFFKVVQAS